MTLICVLPVLLPLFSNYYRLKRGLIGNVVYYVWCKSSAMLLQKISTNLCVTVCIFLRMRRINLLVEPEEKRQVVYM